MLALSSHSTFFVIVRLSMAAITLAFNLDGQTPPAGSWGPPVQHNLDVDGNNVVDFTHEPPIGRRIAMPSFRGCGVDCVTSPDELMSSEDCTHFKAAHMALIAKGSLAGCVLVFDSRGGCGTTAGEWYQRWAILDCSGTYPVVVHNGEISQVSQAGGDLFCSGHAWTEGGDLFVAGGTSDHSFPQEGNRLAFLYIPPAAPPGFGQWIQQSDMAKDRWYPSVTRSSNGEMEVSGGSQDTGPGVPENTTEFFIPGVPQASQWRVNSVPSPHKWFEGPVDDSNPNQTIPLYDLYPRNLLITSNKTFLAGPKSRSASVDVVAAPEAWDLLSNSTGGFRHDGAALIYPDPWGLPHRVMILGGANGNHTVVYNSVEICTALATPHTWTLFPSMQRNRVHLNAVMLPDASVLAVGGNDISAVGYHFQPEWLEYGSSTWEMLAPAASERDYHSTAVLLPDGRVLTGGGDNRSWDYQIFLPPYFDDAQDEFGIYNINVSRAWGYQTSGAGAITATFDTLPTGVSVAQVVLMSPGLWTHHSDFDQRYVDLQIVPSPPPHSSVTFLPPAHWCHQSSSNCAPKGYYMLFLVSSLGVPYGAGFIRLQ